ncbi:MAG: type II restriction endonuclease [Gammaproteobacteria bacterium]|nr:type II restriction endonuclease [Gammaproteobacteria bacterium]
MALIDLTDWLVENHFSQDNIAWCVKRLSGNDTFATSSHQAGIYMPRQFMFEVFPSIDRSADVNPDVSFDLYIDSHAGYYNARAVYYNQKSRNEVRITRLGGATSPLLDSESTGALSIFSFNRTNSANIVQCNVWVCNSVLEEDVILDSVGWVEPGSFRVVGFDGLPLDSETGRECNLNHDNIPSKWFDSFPSVDEVIEKVVELCSFDTLDADERLIRRRECEYELFRKIEEILTLPIVRQGFETVEEFVSIAQATLQRRRVRSGRSLELHMRQILKEEGLQEHKEFSYNVETENGKRTDFLFPTKVCYDDTSFPSEHLRMLAVMTTCRERWRTIISVAKRISVKHLLTLQQGISVEQFSEMKNAGVQLVVPTGQIASYPPPLREELTTIESFVGDIRLLKSEHH